MGSRTGLLPFSLSVEPLFTAFHSKGGKRVKLIFFSFLNLYVLCVHFLCSITLCIVGYTAFGRSVDAFKVSSNITAIVTVDYYY